MIWNKNKECMSRDEMHNLQSVRLHKLVALVYRNVPFYREKMQAMDIDPSDIQSIDDIVKLPFTTKQDLRDNYPTGLQSAAQSEIVRIHASSGTTGNPTIVGYTRKDLEVWAEGMARALTAYVFQHVIPDTAKSAVNGGGRQVHIAVNSDAEDAALVVIDVVAQHFQTARRMAHDRRLCAVSGLECVSYLHVMPFWQRLCQLQTP